MVNYPCFLFYLAVRFLLAVFLSSGYGKKETTNVINKFVLFDISKEQGRTNKEAGNFLKEVVQLSFQFTDQINTTDNLMQPLIQNCLQVPFSTDLS